MIKTKHNKALKEGRGKKPLRLLALSLTISSRSHNKIWCTKSIDYDKKYSFAFPIVEP